MNLTIKRRRGYGEVGDSFISLPTTSLDSPRIECQSGRLANLFTELRDPQRLGTIPGKMKGNSRGTLRVNDDYILIV